MAITTENVDAQPVRGITYWVEDGAGTPLGLYFRAAPGQASATFGGHNTVYAQDESGDFIGAPRKGTQAGPSTLALSGVRVHGAGGNATTLSLLDLLTQSGTPFGTLTSTDTDSDWDNVLSLKWKTIDAGTLKGATYTLTKVTFQPGASYAVTPDGITASFTLQSPDAYPSITEN